MEEGVDNVRPNIKSEHSLSYNSNQSAILANQSRLWIPLILDLFWGKNRHGYDFIKLTPKLLLQSALRILGRRDELVIQNKNQK